MSSQDIAQINRHLAALRAEIAELRDALEHVAAVEREATLQEVIDVLHPTLDALVACASGDDRCRSDQVVALLERALPELGLSPWPTSEDVLELWPEEANDGFSLDRPVPRAAAMARIKVLAPGWSRGMKVVARPRGQVLEVIEEERDV